MSLIATPPAEPARGSTSRRIRRAFFVCMLILVLALLVAVAVSYLRFHSHLAEARLDVERGHSAAAARHLQKCRSLWIANREVVLLSSRVARRSGSWEDADRLLDEYAREYGDDDDLVFERLMLKATRGDLDSAAPRLLAAIDEGKPGARLAREAIIVGLLHRFRWSEAERNIEVWLKTSPDDSLAWFHRGKFQEQRQQSLDAINSYRKVLALDSEHDEARLRLTTLLLQQRLADELLMHLEYLRPRLPDLPEVHVQWAKALALHARNDEARAAIDECLRRFPDFPPALAERGSQAIQAGDDKTAEEYLARAIKLSPGDYTARAQYAVVLARNGKAAESAREKDSLRQLEADQERIAELIAGPLQLRPRDPAVPHEIALIALRSGQPAEAHRWLLAALALDSEHGPTHQVLANYHQAVGNPALAAKHRALARQFSKKP